MHDPSTLAFELKYPWRKYGRKGRSHFERTYRETFVSVWHVDPDLKGDDDSCGWFMRSRHGNKEVLERIVKRFESDWDRSFEHCDKTYHTGLFFGEKAGVSCGYPAMSTAGIALNLFFVAALEHFDNGKENWGRSRHKAERFMQRNLFEILLFAENPTDSLHTNICNIYDGDVGPDKREERIRDMACCVYGWILRATRPWWRHPRFHVHHWQIRVSFVSNFKRWAFSRCQKCGKGFAWGYAPVSTCWDSEGPKWFRSEKYVEHSDCRNPTSECVAKVSKETGADGK